MKHIIQFKISKGEDGYYVASADDVAIFTQGKTFEDLLKNIKDAVEISLDDIDVNSANQVFPPVMMSMDFSEIAHA